MFSLSVVSRRAATMTMRRGATSALFSTRSYAQAEAVEELLKAKQWADVKDEMKEIRELMDEVKTNHAVHLPDAQFEGRVVDNMEQIQKMIENTNAKKEVADRVFDLKMEVKGKLYHD
jgi:hypothetical protein